jgi:hypothetical protein
MHRGMEAVAITSIVVNTSTRRISWAAQAIQGKFLFHIKFFRNTVAEKSKSKPKLVRGPDNFGFKERKKSKSIIITRNSEMSGFELEKPMVEDLAYHLGQKIDRGLTHGPGLASPDSGKEVFMKNSTRLRHKNNNRSVMSIKKSFPVRDNSLGNVYNPEKYKEHKQRVTPTIDTDLFGEKYNASSKLVKSLSYPSPKNDQLKLLTRVAGPKPLPKKIVHKKTPSAHNQNKMNNLADYFENKYLEESGIQKQNTGYRHGGSLKSVRPKVYPDSYFARK